jgi:signal transduction histidine kinase
MTSGKLIARFDDLSVRHKILAGYAALIMPFLALVVVAGAMSARILTLSHQINNDSIPLLEALQSARHLGIAAIEATNTFALISALGPDAAATPTADGSDRQAELVTAREAFSHAVLDYLAMRTVDGGNDLTFQYNIKFAHDDIIRQSNRIARLSTEHASTAIVMELRDRFERSAASFRSLIDAAIDAERSELADRQRGLSQMTWSSAIIVIGFGVIGIALAMLGGLRVSERIAHPIRRLRDAALRIGDGNFEISDQRRTGDEVGELVGAFHTMVQRLQDSISKLARQERLATLGQLAGTVSHELRNPLGVIRNSLFSLRECLGDNRAPGADKIVDRIERNIARCNIIVSDLLDFARSGEIKRDAVDVDGWLAATLDEHAFPASITLRREIRFGGQLALDRERFRQVLVNLLDNAIQAIEDPAWLPTQPRENMITVRSEAVGPYFQLSVIDTGPGIPAPTLARIFEPLFTTKSFGVGLGLPMVRQIVLQHGGSIDVTSNLGSGTAVVIRIPAVAHEQEKAA